MQRSPRAAALDRLPPDVFSPSDAADAGVDSRTLYRLRDAGQIDVVGRGLYRKAGTSPVDVDLLEVATRAPRATICLLSALAHHELVDAIPARLHVAVPRGDKPPRVHAAARWHVFDANTFDVGRDLLPITGTRQVIGIYSAERSIVDAFRLRGGSGYEVAVEALRTWLHRRGAHPADLLWIADQLPRSKGPLRQALDHLA